VVVTQRVTQAPPNGTYGRTDVLDIHNFVEWVSRDDAPRMVSEVEALITKYLAEREAA
jgi:hypothetical protein